MFVVVGGGGVLMSLVVVDVSGVVAVVCVGSC